jgi:hypothetical protein
MGNLRDLKAFVRYDGSGRVVAGSLIFRKKKPTIGNFQEINSYKCCNYDQSPVVVVVQTVFPFTYPDFVIQGDGGNGQYLFTYADYSTPVNDVFELAAYYNNSLQYLGKFTVVGGDLVFNPNATTAAIFVGSGATALQAFSFAD